MKKSISILLSLFLILCGFPFTVSAGTSNLVNVEIIWDDMVFVYSPTWDATKCEYFNNDDGWKAVGNANRISVKNNSEFNVVFEFSCKDMVNGIELKFYDSVMSPLMSDTITVSPDTQEIVRVLPWGAFPSNRTENMSLGKIVIGISIGQ